MKRPEPRGNEVTRPRKSISSAPSSTTPTCPFSHQCGSTNSAVNSTRRICLDPSRCTLKRAPGNVDCHSSVSKSILNGGTVQVLVEDHRVMQGSSVRIEGIPGGRPRADPSDSPVQVRRRLPPLRVQCQEAEPGAPRRVFDGAHQPNAQSRAAAWAPNQPHHAEIVKLLV